jgi:D-aminopeptidase
MRLRELGLAPGTMPTGRLNAITDVAGVEVGHATLIRGEGRLVVGQGPVRTGVTAILPVGRAGEGQVLAADFTLNGNGEMTGIGGVRRTGRLGAPILLTSTSSVGMVYDAALGWMVERRPGLMRSGGWPEPVVGETWDDFLNDTEGRHVRAEHVREAIEGASGGPVAEGCVGGGTGMVCYGFKGGVGTSSRMTGGKGKSYTVGVLVQANHGRRPQLTVAGVPVGREVPELTPERGEVKGKSILVIVATDAPLLPSQLQRLAKRTGLGLARTGALSMHSSGDLALAFSTANRLPEGDSPLTELEVLDDEAITPLYQATIEATEEAVLNALTTATTMTGRDGNRVHALPLGRLVEILRRYGRLK